MAVPGAEPEKMKKRRDKKAQKQSGPEKNAAEESRIVQKQSDRCLVSEALGKKERDCHNGRVDPQDEVEFVWKQKLDRH